MPPKSKLHQKVKANNSFSKPTEDSKNIADVQEQFEVELYWCIHKLQTTLSTNKLNSKQMEDTTKYLRQLSSRSTPFIQKRQLMHALFGDYRKKMSEEEKKLNKVTQQISVKTLEPNKNSVFIKKSVFTQTNPNFKFNFEFNKEKSNTEDKNTNELSKLTISSENQEFVYQPSNNSFRFNFNKE